MQDEREITRLCDSLDGIQYNIPTIKRRIPDETIIVKNQKDWDSIVLKLAKLLNDGKNNITIDVLGKDIEFGNGIVLRDLYYPDANIRIIGSRGSVHANNKFFVNNKAEKSKGFYVYPAFPTIT